MSWGYGHNTMKNCDLSRTSKLVRHRLAVVLDLGGTGERSANNGRNNLWIAYHSNYPQVISSRICAPLTANPTARSEPSSIMNSLLMRERRSHFKYSIAPTCQAQHDLEDAYYEEEETVVDEQRSKVEV